ncbi:MAG: TraB/GumN family protein [Flavobacteriales bacterium]
MRPLVLASFLFPFLLHAQGTPKALLWRIQGPGLARSSYLAGTMHSRDSRAFTHAGPMLDAIDSCDVVAGELDLSALGADAERLRTKLFMPPGTGLADLLPKRKLKRVDAALKEELGAMKGMFARFRPIYLAMMLSEKAQRADSALVLDQYLQERAQRSGREVMGIESAEEQLAAIDALPLQEQADMLYRTVREEFHRKGTDPLLLAYEAQDLDRLLALTRTNDRAGQLLEHTLIDSRNRVMAQRMADLMAGGRACLFAIGAAHLPGGTGVIALLREKGYRVEPVVAP